MGSDSGWRSIACARPYPIDLTDVSKEDSVTRFALLLVIPALAAGGVRSYFDREVSNVYDEAVATKRSDALKTKYRSDIEARWDELKKK